MIRLPEPLETALRGAVRLMVNGLAGASGRGSEVENYAAYWKTNEGRVIPFMAQEARALSRQELTIRLAHRRLFPKEHIRLPHHRLAVCDIDTDLGVEDVVRDPASYRWLYVLLTPSEPADSLGVRRVRPR